MPYGKLPVLEIDGKLIAQSNAVARYLARKYNLAGKDEWESMLCDLLVDTLGDLKQCKCCAYLVHVCTVPNSFTKLFTTPFL
jgi:glutathione S-transferase